MRKNGTYWLIVLSLFGILSLLAGYYSLSAEVNSEIKAEAAVLPQPEVSIMSDGAKSMVNADVAENKKEINGIRVWANNLIFESGRVTIDLCFDLPDDGDWLYSSKPPFLIKEDGHQVVIGGGRLIELYAHPVAGKQLINKFDGKGNNTTETIPADENTRSWRCDQVYFETDAQPGPVTLVVPGLMARPREGQTCSEENLGKVQRYIESKVAGVTVACSPDSDGISGLYSIQNIPAGLQRESVETFFKGLDFYDNVFGILGPWELQLKPE